MSQRRSKAIVLAAVGLCAACFTDGARACDYHWALGVPEPTGDWSAMGTASALKTSSLSATAAAINALNVVDASSDASITKWMQNTTNKKGHSPNATINNLVNKINADVQTVAYTSTNVYVHATGVPSHDVGPFTGNPAAPSDRNRTVDLPRTPTENKGTKTAVGLGVVGVMVNGVAFFDPRDAATYNNQGVWHQNANVFEASSFDSGPGHPVPDMNSNTTPKTGNYHYHEAPLSLLNQLDPGNTGQHASPLIGFAFDGFPVYGPYDFLGTDMTGAVALMTSSYQLRNITTRTTLPDGSAASFAGPSTASVTLGSYVEDYAYQAGTGTLDQYNGRFEITADYPQGTYCYHVTLDSTGKYIYPYIIGPSYYGVVQADNMGMGTINIPANATLYTVPEPSAAALLCAGGAMLLSRSRKS